MAVEKDKIAIMLVGGGRCTKAISPAEDADCNSNPSLAGSQHELDNSDYQWFLDYNPLLRDGSCHHASVLSSLSASYKGIGELTSRFNFTSRYDDLARDLDANLAEADMESFKTEDIHALLMTANGIGVRDDGVRDSNRRGEMYASISSSLMEKFRFDSSMSHHSSSQGEDSTAGSINTMSLCKSELLFSPVKEAPHPGAHFSIDSLDCDLDLVLTCQANKDNYTIAFEGSVTAYSEDSELVEPAVNENSDKKDKSVPRPHDIKDERMQRNLELLEKCHKLTGDLATSMARSDSGLTTWSKLKKESSQTHLTRHPSDNNNQAASEGVQMMASASGSVLKSQSLPNLFRGKKLLLTSVHSNAMSNSTIDSFTAHQRLAAAVGGCMKVYDVSHRSNGSQHSEAMSTSSTDNQLSSDKQQKQGFSLVKLFMKQKSISNEGIVCMDQSDRSECWPNSSEGNSGDSFAGEYKAKKSINKHLKMNISDDCQYDNRETDVETQNKTANKESFDTMQMCENRIYNTIVLEEDEITEITEPFNKFLHLESQNATLCDSESNLYATINKPVRKNLNNNNSFDSATKCLSPLRLRNYPANKKSVSSQSSGTSATLSSCSESEGTQITKLHRLVAKDYSENRTTSTQISAETIDRSMQTSWVSSISASSDKNVVKVIEPSFLEKLKEGGCEKPVYVLYPSYTLPDLSFLTKEYDKIYLKPQKFCIPRDEHDSKKKKVRHAEHKGKRPFSCTDMELLKKKGLSHIHDWESLKFLLPSDFKQLLSEVPEIAQQIRDKENESAKSKEKKTPSPSGKTKLRPASCDCNNVAGNTTNVSSSSSTATQPSSGYRGSSMILTDSSAQNSPAPTGNINPLFVYRYDSATSSEASFVTGDKHKTNPPLPKRSISLAEQNKIAINGKLIDLAPPRPPLPKGILRKSSEKSRKIGSGNTKRYSMFEMDEYLTEPIVCNNSQVETKTKRRSLQEPYYLQKNNLVGDIKKNNDIAAKRLSQQFLDAAEKDAEEYYHDEGVGTESSLDSGKSHDLKSYRPHTPPLPKHGVMEFPPPCALISSADLQQLEEFLKQSGFSCQNMEDWDNTQIQKVRNQVTKFLSMKRSQEENERSTDSSDGGGRKSVSFAGKETAKMKCEPSLKLVEEVKASLATPPNSPNIGALIQRQYQGKKLAEIPIREEGECSPEEYSSPTRDHQKKRIDERKNIDIAQKRAIVSSVTDAVEVLIQHFSPATDQAELALLGDSTRAPACAKLALGSLCPALYAVFRDGLKDNIETSFGDVNNSVWQMVEASARQGPITKALNELVMRINSEDAITEGLVKFNAFVLGLLNAHSVDAWVSYIRTRESILKRHYHADSLLYAATSGDPSCKALLDTLLASLEPLSLLPFRLDLMFEMKELHRSFKRVETDLQNQMKANGGRPANIAIPSLTTNQKNLLKLVRSIQSSCMSSDGLRDESVTQTSVIMRHKEPPSFSKEPSTPDLLNDSAYAKPQSCTEKTRPRSCVNPTVNNYDECPNNSRIDLEQRRWSGVQLGSKLMQAFDRLALYDDSDDYTDSLENNRRAIAGDGPMQSNDDENSVGKFESLADDTYSSEGYHSAPGHQHIPPGGGKFRRLQLKWEMLSNGENEPSETPGEQSPVASRSRIPRPVTSPVRPPAALTATSPAKHPHRGIPVPVAGVRKGASPTTPPGPAKVASGVRSRPGVVAASSPTKRQIFAANSRTSRLDQPPASAARPSVAARPSSLPYQRSQPAHPPALAKRRAISSSLGRAAPGAQPKKTSTGSQCKPRMVRTLWHRLPSDSGHLAFNEGEKLRLILEVDDQWLLCCRGEQKGLVPRNAIIFTDNTLNKL